MSLRKWKLSMSTLVLSMRLGDVGSHRQLERPACLARFIGEAMSRPKPVHGKPDPTLETVLVSLAGEKDEGWTSLSPKRAAAPFPTIRSGFSKESTPSIIIRGRSQYIIT